VRLSELSRLTGLEAPLVSREVGELAAGGHVRRKADPSDGRAGIIALTPKGRRASEAYRSAADEIIADVLSSWSAADLHDLATHLERVVRDFAGPTQNTRASESLPARAAI
jgi:DNA-binding MarR family transcriptional regulator